MHATDTRIIPRNIPDTEASRAAVLMDETRVTKGTLI